MNVGMNTLNVEDILCKDRGYSVCLLHNVSGEGRSHYLESPDVIDMSKVDISTITDLDRYYELLNELSKLTGKIIVTKVQEFCDGGSKNEA